MFKSNTNTNLKPSEILAAAKHTILMPQHWMKGGFHGTRVDADTYKTYQCYCMLGAINQIAYDDPTGPRIGDKGNYPLRPIGTAAKDYIRQVLRDLNISLCIDDFNDDESTRHEDVLVVFDLAIDAARKDECEKPFIDFGFDSVSGDN